MFYKGQFIARIPNDENAKSRIEEYKAIHGQLRLWGRHPRRKQAMAQNGLTPNFMGDIPHRLSTEIVIYRNENGMTFRQFQNLQVGTMIRTMGNSQSYRQSEIGIVLGKKGKNKIKVALGGRALWTTRQCIVFFERDKK